MKRIPYLYSCLIGMLLLAGCDTDVQVLPYEGQPFVAFESPEYEVAESITIQDASGQSEVAPGIVEAKVIRVGGDISQPLVVNYSVNSEFAVSGSDATNTFNVLTDNQVTIPTNQYFAYLPVTTVNDEDPTGNKLVTLTITSVSQSVYNIGNPGPDRLNSSALVIIVDEDCPFVPATFEGTYRMQEAGSSPYDVTLSLVADVENRIKLDNFLNFPGWTTLGPRNIQLDFNPDPTSGSAIVIPDQALQPGVSTGGEPLWIVGDGKYTACDGSLTINYNIYRKNAGTTWEANSAILYKKQ